MADFYAETDDDDQQNSSITSSHLMKIDLYLKHGSDKTATEINFVLAKVAARIFSVPATSAAIERAFSFTGNIITQKRSKLSPHTVNDIVFSHSYNMYKQRFSDSSVHELNKV